ncbi:YebO family protein [Enterobacteriaceae bacterium EKM102V]|uniref:YebO family protein n=1 Tax=Pantoea TaxID=53335 RepID=UPI00142E5A7C|nr:MULTISPECIES: YebO family protein [Pantoea]KAF6655964.1 YebO family protein [Enterobacteriaceae bacterium EKM102V]KAF6665364.1 YebO family protein [Pantoea sp. EKM103V]
MNELAANPGPLVSYGLLVIILIVAFIAWFFVNRASVRAGEQIRLLESLLEEQKKQNQLLRLLIELQPGAESKKPEDEREKRDFIRLIPER